METVIEVGATSHAAADFFDADRFASAMMTRADLVRGDFAQVKQGAVKTK